MEHSNSNSSIASAPNNHRKLSISIDLNRDENLVNHDIRHLVCEMLSLPANEVDQLTVKPVTGGLTNRLFLVENPAHPEYHVIVRFFGEGTHEYIDRDGENMVFSALSEHKFGPKFEGLFENGRVEGYLHARALSPQEMSHPSVYRSVANLVHKLHTIHLPNFFSHQRGSGNKTDMPEIHPDHTQANHASPWIWQKIHIFFSLIDTKVQELRASSTPEDLAKLEKYEALGLDKMMNESKWLQHKIETIISQLSHHMHYHDHVHGLKAPDGIHELVSKRDKGMAFALEEVLCHNDLLSGNLMVMNNSPFLNPDVEDNSAEVRLIDYEYAAYNYRGYDLANHFCGKCSFYDFVGVFGLCELCLFM